VAIIFTPDDTHKPIASACLARGLHVFITKPPVKTLAEHTALAAEAAAAGCLAAVEVHKRCVSASGAHCLPVTPAPATRATTSSAVVGSQVRPDLH
jgi:hypothetical protein